MATEKNPYDMIPQESAEIIPIDMEDTDIPATFEVAEDGSVVYVDEFSRMTIEEAVQKKLAANDRTKWVVKKPIARGSGAVGGGTVSGSKISEGDLKYFLHETQNMDEQTRIYRQQGAEVWRKYREMAESR